MRNQSAYRIVGDEHSLKVDVLYSNAAVGTQILITADSDSILVDAGDGALRDLVDRGFEFETLKAVLLTHEHFDHVSGLYSLVNFLTLLGRSEPLLITTPRPSVRVHPLLHPPFMYYSPQFPISVVEMSGGDEKQIGPFRFRAFQVSHAGTSTLGYSILDDDGHKIVISGDTQPCPNLEREVIEADIALLECTYEDDDREIAHEYGHMTRSEARIIAKKAKRAILIHNSPKGYFRDISCGSRPT